MVMNFLLFCLVNSIPPFLKERFPGIIGWQGFFSFSTFNTSFHFLLAYKISVYVRNTFLLLFYKFSLSCNPLYSLSPPNSPLAIVRLFLTSMSLVIFCLLFLCNSMDGTGEHYAKWNKPGDEGQIPYDLTFIVYIFYLFLIQAIKSRNWYTSNRNHH